MWDRSQVLSSQMAFERKMAFTRKMVVRRASIHKQRDTREEVGPCCYLVHKNNGWALLREVDLLPRKNCCWRFYWHVRQLTWQLQALEALLRHFLSDLHFMSLKKQGSTSSILAGKFDGDTTTASATARKQSKPSLPTFQSSNRIVFFLHLGKKTGLLSSYW